MPDWAGVAIVAGAVYLAGFASPFLLAGLALWLVEIGAWLEDHPPALPTSGLTLKRYRAWLWNLRLWTRGILR